jgi:hypothetical protein
MQTIISEIVFSFADDAIALATGFKRIAVELAADLVAAARTRIMAPIDHLARACDVAGTLSARDQANRRASTGTHLKTTRASAIRVSATWAPRRQRDRFDVLGIRAAFRTLRDLT